MFPAAGITRERLARYYARVAPALLPYLAGRWITVRRWPEGVDAPGFYQRHPLSAREGAGPGITIATAADLVRWVGWGTVEFHAPLGPAAAPDRHDWAVMDLDPEPEAGWDRVRTAAEGVLWLLERAGLPYRLKTSGHEGLHIFIPIRPLAAGAVTLAMGALARAVAAALPETATVERQVDKRGPRVYLDYLQNADRRSMVAPYSVRGTAAARVSTPIRREELPLGPAPWTLEVVERRLATEGDLFAWEGPRADLSAAVAALGLPAAPGRSRA
ncbi:ATP-dependent DNA ligase clustered with Ku protein, LigD [Candidatus Hydrogenisulfobacillus filiaventi]|uniref:ATP-dependent DNA ligase clustered with Ku protein, LigD n=1 Tax=Candidatus Hydrogenisulfobacillus filiaventi TaxID=2707344 RepID=A0A6F8ZGB0_9FIRM|nr:ATP-dependent DNA ligase clustered with Ku protein, LigD [Candidatus Hydrogenisulfobacillus filiaventi]